MPVAYFSADTQMVASLQTVLNSCNAAAQSQRVAAAIEEAVLEEVREISTDAALEMARQASLEAAQVQEWIEAEEHKGVEESKHAEELPALAYEPSFDFLSETVKTTKETNENYILSASIPKDRITDVRGDGNCFYRSIALLMFNDENRYADVKNLIRNAILEKTSDAYLREKFNYQTEESDITQFVTKAKKQMQQNFKIILNDLARNNPKKVRAARPKHTPVSYTHL